MKKHYLLRGGLSLLLLLVTCLAKAETVTEQIFYFAFPNDIGQMEQSAADVAATGGTATWSGMGNNANNLLDNTANDGCVYYKMTSNSSVVTLKLAGGERFKAGDMVSITLNRNSQKSGIGCHLKTQGTGNTIKGDMTEAYVAVTAQGVLTADDINDDGTISLYRINSDTYINAFKVERTRTVRTFTDFTLDLSDGKTHEATEVPEGVTFQGTTHGSSHGYLNFRATVPVDGPVEITIGGCQYNSSAKDAYVYDGETLIGTIDVTSVGCYHNGGKATYTYNEEKAATLNIVGAEYTPYLGVKAVEKIEDVVIRYYDTDGTTKLGEVVVKPNSSIDAFAYGENDVTMAEGQVFRGWYTSVGRKVVLGETVQGDLTLYAKATAREIATESMRYLYDLTNAYFYPEDHELFSVEGGKYHNNHGFIFAGGNTIKLEVGGKAYVQLTLCQYSADGNIVVTDAAGNTVATIAAKSATDGATETFFYDGEATTLTLTFPQGGSTYMHKVAMYGVTEAVEKGDNGWYTVKAGDANSLMLTLMNLKDGDKVFIPNGIYDLGETVLTSVSKNNVSLIGQSMEGTIIKNMPPVEQESINNTATLYVAGSNVYLQDLTLENGLDYYKNDNGRAVCLHDRGNRTICKNVRLLSFQDTYYTNNYSAQLYWETSEIHGTVDFICGGGDVVFNNSTIVVEKRKKDGTGECTITAPTTSTQWGYVFSNCTVKSNAEAYNFGRAWQNTPKCVFLNSTLEKAPIATRWNVNGMNGLDPALFAEYGSKDINGNDITPAPGTKVVFANKQTELDIVLTDEQAAAYTLENIFGIWAPEAIARQVPMGEVSLADGALSWDAVEGATSYAIFNDGEFVAITDATTYNVAEGDASNYSVRAANTRGGFGPASGCATGIGNAVAGSASVTDTSLYNLQGIRVDSSYKGVVIKIDRMDDGRRIATKLVK